MILDLSSVVLKDSYNPNEKSTNCIFCSSRGKTPDTKRHLSINLQKGVFICFRCGATGKAFDHNDLNLYKSIPSISNLRERVNKISSSSSIDSFIEENLNLNEISDPVNNNDNALTYLKHRGILDHEIKNWNIRSGKRFIQDHKIISKWDGRILFPFMVENNVRYIVGRTISDRNPKYLNSSGSKKYVVYGYHLIEQDQPVLLCEGIISAIAASRYSNMSAIAVLGKHFSDEQLNLIKSKTKIIFKCFDGDLTETENKSINQRLIKNGFTLYEILLPNKEDPDSLGESFLKFFRQTKRIFFL